MVAQKQFSEHQQQQEVMSSPREKKKTLYQDLMYISDMCCAGLCPQTGIRDMRHSVNVVDFICLILSTVGNTCLTEYFT